MTPCFTSLAGRAALLLAATLAAAPAMALFKVVNPDGSITYTDRAPTPTANARVTELGRSGGSATAADTEAAWPAELRQAAQRYPVTLYTTAECVACDNGRQYLKRRGVPYSERRASTEEDGEALERIAGSRVVPALMVGPQPLRGFSESDWTAYLDAAGYPRESRLPRGWQPPPVTPVVERSLAVTARQRPQPSTPPAPAPERVEVVEPADASIRF